MGVTDWLRAKAADMIFRQLITTWEKQPRVGKSHSTDPKALVTHNRGWVYVCASKNAEACSMVPLRVYAKSATPGRYAQRGLSRARKAYLESVTKQDMGDVTEIEAGHPLVELLDRINPHMSKFGFVENTILWQELTGDCYWYAEPGPMGVPLNLWPLPAQYVRVVPDEKQMVAGYLFTKDNIEPTSFDYEEVVHCRYANPGNLWYGLSPLEAAMGAATLLESQQAFDKDLFDNGGIPQVGLIYKQQLSEDQRKTLYSEWRKRFASRARGEKAIILAGGDDIKQIGYPPKEIGAEATRNQSLEEVAAAFGVPMTILKTNESNLASAEAGIYQYMRLTIQPKLVRLQEILTEQLAQRYYDEGLFLAFDECVPADKNYRLQEITTRLSNQMTTINEEREQDGLEPVDWGETPVQLQAAERAAEQAERIARQRPEAEDEEDEEREPLEPKTLKSIEEESFSRMLTEYVVDMARDVDRRLSDAL